MRRGWVVEGRDRRRKWRRWVVEEEMEVEEVRR